MADSRLFIGIQVPEKIKEIASHARVILESKIKNARWVPPENIHLTLKFLGDCQNSQINQIVDKLREALESIRSFSCSTKEFGAFPNPRKARVIWLGLEDESKLTNVHKRIETSLADIGFEADNRGFHPHITLARIKTPCPVKIDSIEQRIEINNTFPVEAVTLLASRLSPTGAVYKGLAEIKLIRMP